MAKPRSRNPPSPARRARPRAASMRPRVKVWVAFDDRVKFGDGRARLLEAVDGLGSLQQAVKRFGMSYRAAWGYFRELERAAGTPFLERSPGRAPTGGTRLTPAGRRFLQQYRRFRQRLDAVVEGHFRRTFGAR